MAFVLRLFPRSIRIKGHLATPAFALGKVSEFRAVVNGNGFEHLREWSPPPFLRYPHGGHDRLAGLSRNQQGYVVFRLLFQKRKRHGFLYNPFSNHGVAFLLPFYCMLRSNYRQQIDAFPQQKGLPLAPLWFFSEFF